MRIELADKKTSAYEALQTFVAKHNLTFHGSDWLANFDSRKIRQCAILNKNNEVIGCFLYYQFKKFGIDFVITPPYTPSIELFYVNPSESVVSKATFDKDIMTLVGDYFDSLKSPYIGLHLPSTLVDTQPLIWKGYRSGVRYTYQIALTASTEELQSNLSSEKRKSINKAAKDGLEIKETRDFAQVEELVLKSLTRQSVNKNTDVIKNILHRPAQNNKCIAFVALHEGKASGASVCVIDRDRAIYLFGGFDDANKHHGAGVACMWRSILKAKEMGLRLFDFEGSMVPGIERYYREFGGKLTPYYKIEKAGFIVKTLMKLKGVDN